MNDLTCNGSGLIGFAEQLNPLVRARSESINDVYVGHVVLPGGSRRAQAYVKMFPFATRGQLAYNEFIAYHLAVQCGLPTPLTFPCACRVSLLRKPTREIMCPSGGSQFALGVASIDVSSKKLTQRGMASEVIWADVMNWKYIANVAVFDELLGNDDRHIDNLVRIAPGDYSIIDNERILFGESWLGTDTMALVSRQCDSNVLADTIAEGTDEVARQRMLRLAQWFVRETVLHAPEQSESIEKLCGAPVGTTDHLIDMLNQRRNILPYLMQYHMEKGDLFRASTRR